MVYIDDFFEGTTPSANWVGVTSTLNKLDVPKGRVRKIGYCDSAFGWVSNFNNQSCINLFTRCLRFWNELIGVEFGILSSERTLLQLLPRVTHVDTFYYMLCLSAIYKRTTRERVLLIVDGEYFQMPYSNFTSCVKNFASWGTQGPYSNITMDGIFVDDMANNYNTSNLNYYTQINSIIKSTMPNGHGFSMMNPGSPVDVHFYSVADNIITYEDTYQNINKPWGAFDTNTNSQYSNCPRQKQTFIAYNFTGSLGDQQQLSDTMGETNVISTVHSLLTALTGDHRQWECSSWPTKQLRPTTILEAPMVLSQLNGQVYISSLVSL